MIEERDTLNQNRKYIADKQLEYQKNKRDRIEQLEEDIKKRQEERKRKQRQEEMKKRQEEDIRRAMAIGIKTQMAHIASTSKCCKEEEPGEKREIKKQLEAINVISELKRQ